MMVMYVMVVMWVVVRPMMMGSLTRSCAMGRVLVSMRTMSRLSVRHMIRAFSLPLPLTIKFALCTLTVRSFPLCHDLRHALPLADVSLPVHAL